MYVASTAKRYFDITIEIEGGDDLVLHLKPPSVEALEKFTSVQEAAVSGVNVFRILRESVAEMLRNNRDGVEIPDDLIGGLDYDQLRGILSAFLFWLRAEKEKN